MEPIEMGKPTRLNTMQQYMINLFERELSPQQEAEIKHLLSTYFAQLVDEEMDVIVAQQNITADYLEGAAAIHRRTPYTPKR